MKRTASYDQWTDPALPMSADYHRMSYALYRFDGDFGRVIATRNPDGGLLAEGDYIQDRLELSDEAMAYMTDCDRNRPPLFVLTKAGLGILSNRYGLTAGMGLYLHVHTRPDSGARILNSGAFGYGNGADFGVSEKIRSMGAELLPRDTNAYSALLEAWQGVLWGAKPLLKTESDGSITLTELRTAIRKLAAFVGVELSFTLPKPPDGTLPHPHTRVKCYRPLMTEGLLLCLLTEMRTRSATRGGVCRFELPEKQGRDGMTLTLRCPVDPSMDTSAEQLRQIWHSHMTRVGEQGGMDVWFPPQWLPPRADGDLPEWAVTLDQLLDPSVLESSDLKARLRLAYGEGKHQPPTGDEILFS